ncbi:MAG: hypothetical protein KAI29_22580 [Cyclobacteriaceae bacterium]|nr:hypothetical protein [Cyclobacteriaceae bacterium]
MKIRLIKPCSEAMDKVIIEGEINLKMSIEEMYKKSKSLQYSKILFLPSMRVIWVSVNSTKIIIFESGRIIISRCNTKEEGENLIKMIENMQG